MKKFSFMIFLLWIVFLCWCENSTTAPEVENNETITEVDDSEVISYKHEMKQPKFDEMTNKEEIQKEEYSAEWTTDYILSEDDVDLLTETAEYCSEGFSLIPYYWDDGSHTVHFTKKDLKVGNKFTVSWRYAGYNRFPLTWAILKQIAKYGFWVEEFPGYKLPSYEGDYWEFNEEEWVAKARQIGWQRPEYERYPFNTLLVTNDLLLHVFHKIFDNELQYFEESQARAILANHSELMFNTFKNAQDNKELNEFLAAYWAIPYALLESNEELSDTLNYREQHMWDNFDYTKNPEPKAEFSDEELKVYFDKRFEWIVTQVAKKYQAPLKEAWKNIREWKEKKEDVFLKAYSPKFIQENGIDQDYTQFRPRSHYTNSSFLKTYFMATKWLMRERFYLGDKNLASAALYLANAIPTDEWNNNLSPLMEQINSLIWSDDDSWIPLFKLFYATELNWNIANFTEELHEKLMKEAVHQRINSTAYKTSSTLETDEESAKSMLDAFVYFWEKFTIDSYIFDLMTAGSAEVEFLKKPNIQTALIVPDILQEYAPVTELVNLWLNKKGKDGLALENETCGENGEICKQISSYPEVKKEAQESASKVLEEDTLLSATIYHKRLDLIGGLFTKVKNEPYFKKSPLYVFKNLTTYLGSYTELKHDTLLYVKQAYAEMWGGGPDGCSISVFPPELPVPKGYIEADVNFIDRLIELNDYTTQWFDNKVNFEEFNNYLLRIRNIAIQQMNDEVISDDDFEWLRLSYEKLNSMTYPRKLFGQPGIKLERGALIADIFTSEGWNPLYEAVGRPLLMALMVKDANGARIVLWPIFSHYEFYQADKILEWDQRYTDEDWQTAYDKLESNTKEKAYSLPMQKLFDWLTK